MSLEIRLSGSVLSPLPSPILDTKEKGANAVGMSIPPPATTESEARDRSTKKHIIFLKSGIFFMKVGGAGGRN
jgi:hypothetical protein